MSLGMGGNPSTFALGFRVVLFGILGNGRQSSFPLAHLLGRLGKGYAYNYGSDRGLVHGHGHGTFYWSTARAGLQLGHTDMENTAYLLAHILHIHLTFSHTLLLSTWRSRSGRRIIFVLDACRRSVYGEEDCWAFQLLCIFQFDIGSAWSDGYPACELLFLAEDTPLIL